MFALRTFSWLSRALFEVFVVGLVVGQNPTLAAQSPDPAQSPPFVPARKSVAFDVLVDSAIRQERRLIDLMRNFKPIVETYIQEEKPDSDLGTSPKGDDYFLSRLDLSGNAPATLAFADPVRWEVLGEVRCGVVDVRPRENSENRGFVGRLWVEDQDFNIVRFRGAYTSKALSKRAFHFDSWRLNTLGIMWMPAYIYTEEATSQDPANDGLWFKAQTRIWGYDLEHAGDHREFAKPLTDTPVWVDPNRHEASQDLSPANTLGETAYTPEDDVVERLQVAGLMAPDGEVDQILQTVANNLLLSNDLDLAGIRCRVLLTTPLESFVVGRTIVLSRGLLDVLPDEATLAAVLAHELG